MSPSRETEQARALEELCRVCNEPREARLLATEAGFPADRLPEFSTARVFWSTVVEQACKGAIAAGAQTFIERAAELYPANPVFRAALEPGRPSGATDNPREETIREGEES